MSFYCISYLRLCLSQFQDKSNKRGRKEEKKGLRAKLPYAFERQLKKKTERPNDVKKSGIKCWAFERHMKKEVDRPNAKKKNGYGAFERCCLQFAKCESWIEEFERRILQFAECETWKLVFCLIVRTLFWRRIWASERQEGNVRKLCLAFERYIEEGTGRSNATTDLGKIPNLFRTRILKWLYISLYTFWDEDVIFRVFLSLLV